jgi:hypothetical protein
MLKAAFKPLEDLIVTNLHCDPIKGNGGIQKTLIQSLPKPGTYHGEDDLTKFDQFVRGIVRWLNIADLCGKEVRWSHTKNSYVLTSVDIQRTNAISMFLKDSAQHWLTDVVERVPDRTDKSEPLNGRWTFLQIIAGLYRRFIHEASLSKVADQYESVYYSRSRGVEGLFNTLKKYAQRLPTPPDAYNFRKRLVLLLPESITDVMTTIHKVTAERSSLSEIMETAIALEQGEKARDYYHEARRKLERNQRKRSRSRSRSHRQRSEKNNKRDQSPKRLQRVDGRRYYVKPHSPPRNDRPESLPRRDKYNDQSKPKFDRKDNKPFIKPSFSQSYKPNYQSKDQSNAKGQVFKMTDEDGNVRLFRLAEQEVSESEENKSHTDDDTDEKIWARYDDGFPGSDNKSEKSGHSPDSYGGSQYSSESEADERTGFMYDTSYDADSEVDDYSNAIPGERFAGTWDDNDDTHLTLDFGEYFRSIKVKDGGTPIATVKPVPTRSPNVGKRPKRTTAEKRCLAAWIELNGVKAFTLFDSGSTADVISPDFTRAAKIKIFRLENPVTFQLGTKGSRSRVTYGCVTKYSFSSAQKSMMDKDYFDIANVDRYDAVVGTVFMRRHGIVLDFKNNTVKINDSVVPTLTEGEELAELIRRASKRAQSDNIHLNDNEEIEVKPRPKKPGVEFPKLKDKFTGDKPNKITDGK